MLTPCITARSLRASLWDTPGLARLRWEVTLRSSTSLHETSLWWL
ncbi:MAG: hypothetical protein AB2693_25515 [Candidatus Thiodiazotropha sp.]